MTSTDHGPLTVATLTRLATLASAVQRCARVRWLAYDDGPVLEGVARCFAHNGGGFLNEHEDVRDGFVHISGPGECWLPVSDVLGMMVRDVFVVES